MHRPQAGGAAGSIVQLNNKEKIMKCQVCGGKAMLCFSNWPEPGEVCFCERHCSDSNLHKAQQNLRARQDQEQQAESQRLTRKAG